MWSSYTNFAEAAKESNILATWVESRRCDFCREYFKADDDWYQVVGPRHLEKYADNDFHYACYQPTGMTGQESVCDECGCTLTVKDRFFKIIYGADHDSEFNFCVRCLGCNGVGGIVTLQQQMQLKHNYYHYTFNEYCLLNVLPVNGRVILPDFRAEITVSRNEKFIELLRRVVYHDYPATQSLLELVLFTDLDVMDNTSTGFLVQTVAPHAVYSIYANTYVWINNVFKTFQEYLNALEIWQYNLKKPEPFSCFIRKKYKL